MATAAPLELPPPSRDEGWEWRRFQFTGGLSDAAAYVERAADRELYDHLFRGDYCHVLAPRQMGKSSLRWRVWGKLKAAGVRCASIDLTAVGRLGTEEQWYLGFVDEIAQRFGLDDPYDAWQKLRDVPPSRRWADYVRKILAEDLAGQQVVILIDEIEAVKTVSFSADEFFTQIRAFFEARSSDPNCRRLTFCLIGVTTPSDLIKDKVVTPFNVSHGIRLADFSRAEMDALAADLGGLGANPEVLLDAVYEWTDGHPYMTMRTCAFLAQEDRIKPGCERQVVEVVVRREFLEHPYDDANLSYAHRRFDDARFVPLGATVTDKVSLYRRVHEGEQVPSEMESAVQKELLLSGLLKEVDEDGQRVLRVRNRIFATVFDREWMRHYGNKRFLAEAVWKWLDAGKGASYLLRGDALAEAVKGARSEVLSEEEKEFLAASQRDERDGLELEAARLRGAIAVGQARVLVEQATEHRDGLRSQVRSGRRVGLGCGVVGVAGLTALAGLGLLQMLWMLPLMCVLVAVCIFVAVVSMVESRQHEKKLVELEQALDNSSRALARSQSKLSIRAPPPSSSPPPPAPSHPVPRTPA